MTFTSEEVRSELHKVLEAISKVQNLVNSTDLDEAKRAEFREFEDRELKRINKLMMYISTMEEVKLFE